MNFEIAYNCNLSFFWKLEMDIDCLKLKILLHQWTILHIPMFPIKSLIDLRYQRTEKKKICEIRDLRDQVSIKPLRAWFQIYRQIMSESLFWQRNFLILEGLMNVCLYSYFFSRESDSTITNVYSSVHLFVHPSVSYQNPSTVWNHQPSSFLIYPSIAQW